MLRNNRAMTKIHAKGCLSVSVGSQTLLSQGFHVLSPSPTLSLLYLRIILRSTPSLANASLIPLVHQSTFTFPHHSIARFLRCLGFLNLARLFLCLPLKILALESSVQISVSGFIHFYTAVFKSMAKLLSFLLLNLFSIVASRRRLYTLRSYFLFLSSSFWISFFLVSFLRFNVSFLQVCSVLQILQPSALFYMPLFF